MRTLSKKNHIVDLLFAIALFFVFSTSSVVVVLISSNAYISISKQTEENYSARTSLSYVAQKIRQNDINGGISLGEIQNTDALIMKQTYNQNNYTTYIYEYSGALRELFIKDGVEITLDEGKIVMEVQSFSMEMLNPHLFSFSTVDKNGHRCELTVGSRT
ncbi:MAG: DUF4860 domain-containing protein [Lachnospiraceae bacterium]